jgi:BolA protein
MPGMSRAETIERRLRAELDASHVEIEDESHRHAGHPGAASGGGHFRVVVVSPRFRGLDRIARHRAVYAALGEMMQAEIHALSAKALTPEEWSEQTGPA